MRAVETLDIPFSTTSAPEAKHIGLSKERITPFRRHHILDVFAVLAFAMLSVVRPINEEAQHVRANPWRDFENKMDSDTDFELLDTDPVLIEAGDNLVLSNTVKEVFASEGPRVFIDEERVRSGLGFGEFALLTCHQEDDEGNVYETSTVYTAPNAPEEGFGSRGSILTAMYDQGLTLPSFSDSGLTIAEEEDIYLSTLPENYMPINGYGTLVDTDKPAEISLGLYELKTDNSVKLSVKATITAEKPRPLYRSDFDLAA